MGLGAQEVARLTATTDRILGLELRKVRYVRSLSFVQGTAVNAPQTSILLKCEWGVALGASCQSFGFVGGSSS
jgi:hypothetical protein